MKKLILSIFLSLAVVCIGLQATPALAIGPLLDQALIDEVSCVDANNKAKANCNYSLNSFVKLGIRASTMILGVVGALTLLMFVYGGVTLLISAGNTETVSKGKSIIVGAIVGLVIVFTSYILIGFLVNNILGAKIDGQSAFKNTAPTDTGSSTTKRPTDCKVDLAGSCVPASECASPKTPFDKTKECALKPNQTCCVAPPKNPLSCEDSFYDCQAGTCNADGGFQLVEGNPPPKCTKDGDVCCEQVIVAPPEGDLLVPQEDQK